MKHFKLFGVFGAFVLCVGLVKIVKAEPPVRPVTGTVDYHFGMRPSKPLVGVYPILRILPNVGAGSSKKDPCANDIRASEPTNKLGVTHFAVGARCFDHKGQLMFDKQEGMIAPLADRLKIDVLIKISPKN